jgi:ribosomal protein L7/L12
LAELIVEHDGPTPVGVWKLIQRATKLDISRTQAQKLFKAGSQVVIADLPDAQAQALKIEFEALGATVHLQPA